MIQIEIKVRQIDGKDLAAIRFEIIDDADPTGVEKSVAAFLQHEFDNLIKAAGAVGFNALTKQKAQ